MKRKITPVTGLLLALAYFAAPSSYAQEREKLRVSTLFIGSSLVPFWIGQEQGIFAKHGIDVELIWMQSNLSTAALLAGEVDSAFGTPQSLFAVLTAKNPPPLTTIAAWGSASEHWLVVNPAIKTGKDLEGKTIGVSRPRSADHGYTTVILERMASIRARLLFFPPAARVSARQRSKREPPWAVRSTAITHCNSSAKAFAIWPDWSGPITRSHRPYLSQKRTRYRASDALSKLYSQV